MSFSIRVQINLMYQPRAQLLRKKLWKTSSKSRPSRLKAVGTSIPVRGWSYGRPHLLHPHAGMYVPTPLRSDGLDFLLVFHNFFLNNRAQGLICFHINWRRHFIKHSETNSCVSPFSKKSELQIRNFENLGGGSRIFKKVWISKTRGSKGHKNTK